MSLAILVSLPAAATSTVGQWVEWPRDGDLVPRDAVVYLYTASGTYGVTFLDEAGVEVPHDVVPLGDRADALVPRAELAPGVYRVDTLGGPVTFTVEDRLAAPAPPPTPYRRAQSGSCIEDQIASERSWLSYDVCGGGIAHLVAFGEDRPLEPTLDDLGSASLASVDERWVPSFAPKERPLTVWLGDLDEAGRFGGWWQDVLETPVPDGIVTEAPSGIDLAGTAPPEVCAPFTGWDQLETAPKDCSLYDEDEAEPLPEEEEGCGCRTGAGAAFAPLLLLATRRRARARDGGPPAARACHARSLRAGVERIFHTTTAGGRQHGEQERAQPHGRQGSAAAGPGRLGRLDGRGLDDGGRAPAA